MDLHKEGDRGSGNQKKVKIVFVIGGPGSGKGTQCEKIAQQFGYTHLSVGELLRQEINSGSETGSMIQKIMKEGKLVPSDVTVRLLQQAMQEMDSDKFLIDGFPRNEENVKTFENLANMEPEFVLYLDCPQDEMERRLLSRNEGREDDNIETIRKRFKVFMESTVPAVEYYESKGKVRKVDAGKSIDEVFESIKAIFSQGKDYKVPPSRHNSECCSIL
ncbi:UMP-CMP kinase 3-like isoform X1 [Lycium barbarum]|uniref:UMP-CMP kinase 3-like isoform X1 n=2 Tax=Lycium barbarum TaxID=112863 RepID=UPI00293EC06A|nr:UMP-CMP kinase 3-like isoform X1 [Lycium barbarum]XP_060207539.1 UMP-CMP kinase 3-like isoform X1 [Lycium barbarum]XP_060207540.1 UMP-CMP kinase 3-like isoform X1 [Lycium barbarum]